MFRSFVVSTAVLLAILASALPARAETGPLLLIRPWAEKPHWSDTFDEIVVFDRGHVKGTGESQKSFYWDSLGRIKFERENSEPAFSLGYRVLTLDTDSDNRAIDGQLNDVAMVGGGDVGEVFTDWRLNLIGGFGSANDGHWSNSDAVYGIGSVDFAKSLSDMSSLHLGIFYDGNRPLFPDVPLPLVTYAHKFGEEFEMFLGLPDTRMTYRPTDRLTLTFHYYYVAETRLIVDYDLIAGVHIYAGYSHSVRSFNIDERDNRRVFYEVDRATLGVRWVSDWLDAGLGFGYALDHRYRTGFDLRSAETAADLSEEIYASITLQGIF